MFNIIVRAIIRAIIRHYQLLSCCILQPLLYPISLDMGSETQIIKPISQGYRRGFLMVILDERHLSGKTYQLFDLCQNRGGDCLGLCCTFFQHRVNFIFLCEKLVHLGTDRRYLAYRQFSQCRLEYAQSPDRQIQIKYLPGYTRKDRQKYRPNSLPPADQPGPPPQKEAVQDLSLPA